MGRTSKLNKLKDYSIGEALEDLREELQQAEKEQNLLEGGKSVYQFTLKDVQNYLSGIGNEAKNSKNIAPLFKR